jgi:hypothetical protein
MGGPPARDGLMVGRMSSKRRISPWKESAPSHRARHSAGATPPEAFEPDPRLVVPLALVEDAVTRPGRMSLTADDLDENLRSDLDSLLGEEGTAAQLLTRHGLSSLGRKLAFDASPAAASPHGSQARADLARRLAAAAGLPDVRVRLPQWLRPELCTPAVQVLTSKGIASKGAWESGSSLFHYDFAARLPVLLPFCLMLSVAPGAKVAAIVRAGRPWGIQGWLSVIFLALSPGSAAFLLLGRVPLSRLWSWSRPVRAVRLAFWIWFVLVVPSTCLLALVAWWGTWKSFTVGLVCFADVLWVARSMARRQALADLLDDELPLLIQLLDERASE